MTRIYFVRHGQSTGNVAGEFHGHYNSNLTEEGNIQAELAGGFLKDKNIEVFISSDLLRAYNTACHIAKYYNLPVIKNEKLREIYSGKWEKMKFTDIEKIYPDDYIRWKTDIASCRCTDGESLLELYHRVNGEVDRLAKLYDGKVICIATHATPLRVLKCAWMGKDVSAANQLSFVPNASVSEVEYFADGTRKIILDGECNFLENRVTRLPDNI